MVSDQTATARLPKWTAAALFYLCVIAGLTWPLALNLNGATVGFPNVDALDTMMLRGLVRDLLFFEFNQVPWNDSIYFPFGYPILSLTPNLMDHITGGIYSLLFIFPLSDNLWWATTLLASALGAHSLGKQEGGSHLAGILAGTAWLCAEPNLRELNLHHAPQAITVWIPLYLAAALRALRDTGRTRDAVWCGVFLALAGITYWYYAIFLAIGSIGLIIAGRGYPKRILITASVASALALPFMLPLALNFSSLPMSDPSITPPPNNMHEALSVIPAVDIFIMEHGADLLFPFQATPIDRTNRVSLVLLFTIAYLLVRKRGTLQRNVGAILSIGLIGSVFVLGPWLKWGEDPVLLYGSPLSLPGEWLASLHPMFARLTWPERWGILIPLALIPVACRISRPKIVTTLVLLETFLLSSNAPLQTHDLSLLGGWRSLEANEGALLELPITRGGLRAPLVGLHQRFHGNNVVNGILLPPGTRPPGPWKAWMDEEPLISWIMDLERRNPVSPPAPGAAESLVSQGVTAIAIDALPGSTLSEGKVNRYVLHLSRYLGDPEDYGAVIVWWLVEPTEEIDTQGLFIFNGVQYEDGESWREAVTRISEATPTLELDSLIQPTWGAMRKR